MLCCVAPCASSHQARVNPRQRRERQRQLQVGAAADADLADTVVEIDGALGRRARTRWSDAQPERHRGLRILTQKEGFARRPQPQRFWQLPQKNVDRPPSTRRFIDAPQRGHGAPARP